MDIGFHIRKSGSWKKSIKDAKQLAKKYDLNLTCGQLFVAGPQSASIIVKEDDYDDLKNAGITLYVHASYISSPWNQESPRHKFVLKHIKEQMDICAAAGIKGFVIHLPKRTVPEIIEVLQKINVPDEITLYLEPPAMKQHSTKTYETSEKVKVLMDEVAKVNPKIGFCIDTSHSHATGVKLNTKEECKKYLDQFSALGIKLLVHFNDNNNPFGSGKDNHASLGKGKIWSNDTGYKAVIEWCKEHSVNFILERSYDLLDEDLKVLKLLHLSNANNSEIIE